MNDIVKQINDSREIMKKIVENESLINLISEISKQAVNTYKRGNKIMLAGNGGSAADAQHIAGELVSRFYFDRPPLSAIALTTDTSIITAIGNDYGYEKLFERQVQALGNKGDLFFAISTSGNSLNILKAMEACRQKEITVVGFTGDTGGKMEQICDYCIKVPSRETPRIQESHILIGHIICSIIEKEIFG